MKSHNKYLVLIILTFASVIFFTNSKQVLALDCPGPETVATRPQICPPAGDPDYDPTCAQAVIKYCKAGPVETCSGNGIPICIANPPPGATSRLFSPTPAYAQGIRGLNPVCSNGSRCAYLPSSPPPTPTPTPTPPPSSCTPGPTVFGTCGASGCGPNGMSASNRCVSVCQSCAAFCEPTYMTIIPPSATANVGETKSFEAYYITPACGSFPGNSSRVTLGVSWSSANPAIVSDAGPGSKEVYDGKDSNGIDIWTTIPTRDFFALSPGGPVTITAQNGSRVGTAQMTVSGAIIPSNSPPNAPLILGPVTGSPNTVYTYRFTATDPEGDPIRYGIDWNMDGVVDEWLPPGIIYVNSGTTQVTTHSWSSTGNKKFQALAQDAPGLNSLWKQYNVIISVSVSACITNADCNDSNACTTDTCSGGSCVNTNNPVNGGWTGWSACIGGVQTRTCTNPSNSCSGSPCVGAPSQTCPMSPGNLVVNKVGQGIVTSVPAGTINCGVSCSSETATLPDGTPLTIHAAPATNRIFTGWTGCDSVSGVDNSDCTVSVTGNRTVTAKFSINPKFKEF